MEKITLKQKQTRTAMSKEELEKYMDETRKSAHVFKDRSKFDKKKSRREKY